MCARGQTTCNAALKKASLLSDAMVSCLDMDRGGWGTWHIYMRGERRRAGSVRGTRRCCQKPSASNNMTTTKREMCSDFSTGCDSRGVSLLAAVAHAESRVPAANANTPVTAARFAAILSRPTIEHQAGHLQAGNQEHLYFDALQPANERDKSCCYHWSVLRDRKRCRAALGSRGLSCLFGRPTLGAS